MAKNKTEVTQVVKLQVTYIGEKPLREEEIIKRLNADNVIVTSNKQFLMSK